MPLFLGIDVGTSACRAMLINANAQILGYAHQPLPPPDVIHTEAAQLGRNWVEQDPERWWQTTKTTIHSLLKNINRKDITAIAVDGTSATTLLCRTSGEPLGPALMYHDNRAQSQAFTLKNLAPADHPASAATGALAKALWLLSHYAFSIAKSSEFRLMHQADWICGKFLGRFQHSDWNNCLKLGFDAETQSWPQWLTGLPGLLPYLPEVHRPGTVLGEINRHAVEEFGFPPATLMVAGTTDSTAAFIASGAHVPGQAVTTLGSTLVLKIITERPITSSDYGVYSQPLFDRWLVGGASNSGGAVLAHYFTTEQIDQCSAVLDPEHATGLDYYPLLRPGERFPLNDSTLAPRLLPRPAATCQFFQAMLEGIANIEKIGYDRLADLGAAYPSQVISMGGGARNTRWNLMRQRRLGVPVSTAACMEAAYGAALLARRSFVIAPF